MKKTLAISLVISLSASSLLAWVFPDNYETTPVQNYNWNQPGAYTHGDQKKSSHFAEPYQEGHMQQENDGRPLEQKYRKLVVMFTKESCPYCIYMKPIMNAIKNKYEKHGINFVFADINAPEYSGASAQYGFETVPTIIYFKDGRNLNLTHGSEDKTITVEQIAKKINGSGLLD